MWNFKSTLEIPHNIPYIERCVIYSAVQSLRFQILSALAFPETSPTHVGLNKHGCTGQTTFFNALYLKKKGIYI